MTVKRARNDNLLIVTLSDSEGSEGDSSVAVLPQNDSKKGLVITVKS